MIWGEKKRKKKENRKKTKNTKKPPLNIYLATFKTAVSHGEKQPAKLYLQNKGRVLNWLVQRSSRN